MDEAHESQPETFRHRAPKTAPRYAWLLSITFLSTFIGAALRFIEGIHPNHIDWHAVGDGVILTAFFVFTCWLWQAWDREERHPELLPKREFERRYPPSSGSGPMVKLSEGGILTNPHGDHRGFVIQPEREFHRRIPYDTETTMTGGQLPPTPPPGGRRDRV